MNYAFQRLPIKTGQFWLVSWVSQLVMLGVAQEAQQSKVVVVNRAEMGDNLLIDKLQEESFRVTCIHQVGPLGLNNCRFRKHSLACPSSKRKDCFCVSSRTARRKGSWSVWFVQHAIFNWIRISDITEAGYLPVIFLKIELSTANISSAFFSY